MTALTIFAAMVAIFAFGLIGFLVGAVLYRYLPDRTVALGLVLTVLVAIWFSVSPMVFAVGGAILYEWLSRPDKPSKDRLSSG